MGTHTYKTLLRPIVLARVVLARAVMGSVALTLLAGCTGMSSNYGPTEYRNKITVAESVERMELYVQPNGLNLSARDQDAMGDFIAGYARYGEGPLYLNIPGASANGAGVRQARNMITNQLASMGLGQGALQTGQYESAPNTPAPVVVSYRRLNTVPMDCHQGASLTHTGDNQPYGGFGCSQTANLATLIDNPRQLLRPYDVTPVSAARRAVVLGKYVEGQNTATPRPTGQEISAGD